MREEDELLNRTLQRCLREVRRALDADPDVGALATFKVDQAGMMCHSMWFNFIGCHKLSQSAHSQPWRFGLPERFP